MCWFKLSDLENLLGQLWIGHGKGFSIVWIERTWRFKCSDRLKIFPQSAKGHVKTLQPDVASGRFETRRPRDRLGVGLMIMDDGEEVEEAEEALDSFSVLMRSVTELELISACSKRGTNAGSLRVLTIG